MKELLNINEKSIAYTLNMSKRARRMSLAVYCNGDVIVTAPANFYKGHVERFLMQKSEWILDKLQSFMPFTQRSAAAQSSRSRKAEYAQYKAQALALVEKRAAELNQIYGFRYARIAIRNQKSRWGSCSIKGNLSFTYKIALLPEKLADYLIVHELCHLGEFNHSRNFWNLVDRAIPDYKERRKELKKLRL